MICYWPEPLKVACTLWRLDPIMASCDYCRAELFRDHVSVSRLGASLFPPLIYSGYKFDFDCSIFIIPAFPILIFFSCFLVFPLSWKDITVFTAVSCQFLFKLLLCIGVLIARDSESKTNIIIFNSLPRGCIGIRTLSHCLSCCSVV